MVNRVILIGNLGKDPEVRYLDNGVAVARVNVATNKSYKGADGEWQQKTEWHRLVLWRKFAETAAQKLKTGMRVYAEGELTYNEWEDNDGKKRREAQVVVSYIRMLDKQEGSHQNSAPMPSEDDAPPEPADDDLPF